MKTIAILPLLLLLSVAVAVVTHQKKAVITNGMPKASTRYIEARLDVGDTICIPGVDFSKARFQFVLAINEECSFCATSGSLFKALSRSASVHKMPLYVVQSRYENLLDFAVTKIVTIPLRDVGLVYVPSIAVVNSRAIVTAIWYGKPADGEEEKLIDDLINARSDVATPFQSVTFERVMKMRESTKELVIVDPREAMGGPPPLSDVVAIPGRDLAIRARYELAATRPTVIDCRTMDPASCQIMIVNLKTLGFKEVFGLGLKRLGKSKTCP